MSTPRKKRSPKVQSPPPDPSVPEGFVLADSLSIHLEYRDKKGESDVGQRLVTIRFLTKTTDGVLDTLRIELYDEEDLFNIFVSVIDRESFDRLKVESRFNFEFEQFSNELKSVLELPSNEIAVVLYLEEEPGLANLIVNEVLEFSIVELFRVELRHGDVELAEKRAQLRFAELKNQIAKKTEEIKKFLYVLNLEGPRFMKELEDEKVIEGIRSQR